MRFGILESRCGLIIFALSMALCANAQEQGLEISGFRVPEYDEQGQMTSQLFGDHAELGEGGLVKIEGVRVELYRDGEVFMEVTSPYCSYDQKKHVAQSDAPVRADMEGVRLTGTGYLLDADERTVQLLAESRVVFKEFMQKADPDSESVDGGSTNETIITSTQLFLDYNGRSARFTDSVRIQDKELGLECGQLDVFFSTNNEIERAVAEVDVRMANDEWQVAADRGTLMYLERTAFLEGGVQVENQELNLTCTTLDLRFDESNEIDWIEALGEVRILHEGREAHAGKAVYDVATDEFLLEDNPRLVDGKNLLFSDKIRFWRATGRMVCEPAARAVIYPGEKFKTDIFEK